jgi:hypothetical protein
MRAERLLHVALCTALYCAVGSEAPAAQDDPIVTQREATAVHACPSKGDARTVRRPVGIDGRRIRPID